MFSAGGNDIWCCLITEFILECHVTELPWKYCTYCIAASENEEQCLFLACNCATVLLDELWTSASKISDVNWWKWFWKHLYLWRQEIFPGCLSAFCVSWLWPFAGHHETKLRHLSVTGCKCSKCIMESWMPKHFLFLTLLCPLMLLFVKIDGGKFNVYSTCPSCMYRFFRVSFYLASFALTSSFF